MLGIEGRLRTDTNSPTRPRFLQIADNIRAQITSGGLAEHDILPSERALSDRYGVSRVTGRRALQALETEGLVYNADRRGRFVSPKRLRYNVSNMVSFLASAQANDLDLEIKVIQAAEHIAKNEILTTLELSEYSRVIEYTRLFHSGGHPIFIETEYLVADRFPNFLEKDLRQSTSQTLEKSYGTSANTGNIIIRMRGVKANEAKLLNIALSHAIIELEQVIYDDAGTPFCFGRQVWRGEMAEFSALAIVSQNGQSRA